ncbi:MAG: HlyD family type I secretion periplasmic adaptor subunit [Sulfuricella sp.]|nr:HlyD family type I secretion periplasmic adaptor subunit [Sulfuricella sp.]
MKFSHSGADPLDFAPGLLGIQHKPPHPMPRVVLRALALLLAFLLVWAALGRLDVVAVAEGKLIPQSYLKIVQPSEQGIVQDILVKDGDAVKAGQVLMRMDTTLSEADGKALQTDLHQKSLQLRRIDAEFSNRALKRERDDPPAVFREVAAQYQSNRRAYEDALYQERMVLEKARQDLASALEIQSKLKQVLPVYQQQEEAYAKLGKDGYAGKLMVLERSRDRIEKEQDLRAQNFVIESTRATIAQSEQKLVQITSEYRKQLQTERVEALADYEKLQQGWAKQQHRHALLELKAPQGGIVKDLATHTAGTVVSPGAVLMTLVPSDEALQAEVWVSNEDIGFVREGQPVKLKLSAFPFQKYGMTDGVVGHVGADSSDKQDQAGADNAKTIHPLRYRALVAMARQTLESGGESFRLSPGMALNAEIRLADRTVLEYLLSPVQKAFHEAARER